MNRKSHVLSTMATELIGETSLPGSLMFERISLTPVRISLTFESISLTFERISRTFELISVTSETFR